MRSGATTSGRPGRSSVGSPGLPISRRPSSSRTTCPAGWQIVVRDGSALLGPATVALGRVDGTLERKAGLERIEAELRRLELEASEAAKVRTNAGERATAARAAHAAARADEARIGAARRAAEEAERIAARSVERLARESAWLEAGAERAEADLARQRVALAALEAADAASRGTTRQPMHGRWCSGRRRSERVARPGRAGSRSSGHAAISWPSDLAQRDRVRADAEAARARESAGAAMSQDRIDRADAEMAALGRREAEVALERDRLAIDLAAATSREQSLRAALAEARATDAADRGLLVAADAALGAARDRLRAIDERLRVAEVAELESRLALDLIREQVLAELGGLGALGLRALGLLEPGVPVEDDDATVEAIPAATLAAWAAGPPLAEPPSPGRLATLRRRYHELGAANPLAIEEYDEVKVRLEGLETQERDLRGAIATTRALIDELGTLVAEQFKTTFRNLEVAFDARFKQLFGGGYARLELTDPEDLSTTGVEIVARPPGKKAQALAMLSGGERALTAVALLFAMLAVRPVPFCVLDEVDAALDEANIGRFADALRDLADQIQFIVITHNRGTIEAADALYGVTVGDDSVSRVISLRLDEATAIADRSGEPAGLAAS